MKKEYYTKEEKLIQINSLLTKLKDLGLDIHKTEMNKIRDAMSNFILNDIEFTGNIHFFKEKRVAQCRFLNNKKFEISITLKKI